MLTPGPQDYDIPTGFDCSKIQEHPTMGSEEKRNATRVKSKVPGPGVYNPQILRKSPSIT